MNSHLCISAISARSRSISSFSVAICRRSTCSSDISSSCSVRISFSCRGRKKTLLSHAACTQSSVHFLFLIVGSYVTNSCIICKVQCNYLLINQLICLSVRAIWVSNQHLKCSESRISVWAGGLTWARRRLMTSSSFSDISSFDTSSLDRLAISCAILVSHSCRFRRTEKKWHIRTFLEAWHDK